MIVKLVQKSQNYPDLSPQQPYVVIGIEADDYRILNDRGRPYLYPNQDFDIIDATEPSDWHVEMGEDGERYAYPVTLNQPGFFEDFFDQQEAAIKQFWRVINQELAALPA